MRTSLLASLAQLLGCGMPLVAETPPEATVPSEATAEAYVGRYLVHRDYGYLYKVRSAHAAGTSERGVDGNLDEPWLFLENSHRQYRLAVGRVDIALRPPMSLEDAKSIDALIPTLRPVEGQAHLDLRLYINGTPMQSAAAIATLIDRQETGDTDALLDLEFLRIKGLGELAHVLGQRPADYAASLQARRKAVPADQRTATVDPPRLAPLPIATLNPSQTEAPGWHIAAETFKSTQVLRFGDTRLEGDTRPDWRVHHQHSLPSAPGDWHVAVHQAGEEPLNWMVISLDQPATVELKNGKPTIVFADKTTLALPTTHRIENLVGSVGVFGSDTAELAQSVDQAPDGQLIVWPTGVMLNSHSAGQLFGPAAGSPAIAWAIQLGL